jgi:hypothetical protein
VALTGRHGWRGASQRHFLRALSPLSGESRSSALGDARSQALGRQAARDAGESIEEVSRFLDHSSLAVTTTYLRRLEGQEDKGWGRVAEAIGVAS